MNPMKAIAYTFAVVLGVYVLAEALDAIASEQENKNKFDTDEIFDMINRQTFYRMTVRPGVSSIFFH